MDEISSKEKIQLLPRNAANSEDVVEFENAFAQFSNVIEGCDLSQSISVEVDKKVLLIIKRFLEDHHYDMTECKIVKPCISNSLKAHLDDNSYQLMSEFQGVDNVQKLKPLIDAAYYFNFQEFKNVCLLTISCQFYVGTTEQDLQNFCEKHGIAELSPEEEIAVMIDFKPAFDKLTEKFKKQLEEEQDEQRNH